MDWLTSTRGTPRTCAGWWAAAALLCAVAAPAQPNDTLNLVGNGSFESAECPGQTGDIAFANYWFNASGGTPDLFAPCGAAVVRVPHNLVGAQAAAHGGSYAGIFAYNGLKRGYREYVGVQLLQPLVAGQRYRLSVQLSLADYSGLAVQCLQYALLPARPHVTSNGTLPYPPSGPLCAPTVLDNRRRWRRVETEVTAAGGERFLILGNFLPDSATALLETPPQPVPTVRVPERELALSAYYYLDDVRLSLVPAPPHPDTLALDLLGQVPPLQRGRWYVLPQVQFAFDEATLLPQAQLLLNAVADELLLQPVLQVRIVGHTDDSGSDAYNLDLSLRRAQAVAAYLVAAGVDVDRLHPEGRGKSQPAVPGTDDASRAANRRVELQVQ